MVYNILLGQFCVLLKSTRGLINNQKRICYQLSQNVDSTSIESGVWYVVMC